LQQEVLVVVNRDEVHSYMHVYKYVNHPITNDFENDKKLQMQV